MTTTDPCTVDLLAALIACQRVVADERRLIESKIKDLRTRDEQLRFENIEIENQLFNLRIVGTPVAHPISSAPSRRNVDVRRASLGLMGALARSSQSDGLSQDGCAEAIRNAVPAITEATIRSHLHRFKNRGLISKAGARWYLKGPSGGDNGGAQ